MISQYAGGPHRHYDPLLAERPRRRKLGAGAMAGIAISVLVHAGLFSYLWMVKFQPHYEAPASDPGVRVSIARPTDEPPPPPTITRVSHTPPPLAPHLTPPIPTQTTQPLQIPPVLDRLPETTEPPLTVQTPTVQGPVTVQTPPASPPPVIANPDWVRQPNGDDLAQYYPDRAQRLEKAGSALIRCVVTTNGVLSGCRVLSETPEGFGFGEATLKVSRLFRMKPAMQGGQAVQGVVDIPLRWQLK